MKVIFFFVSFGIICQCFGEFQRFIVNIVEYRGSGNDFQSIRQCIGSVITNTTVLTTASYISAIHQSSLTTVEFASTRGVDSMIRLPIRGITLHPNYIVGENDAFNVALVHFNTSGMTTDPPTFESYVPRLITRLEPLVTNCNLIGWDIYPLNPRQDSVVVNGPAVCNLNSQPHIFCTELSSINNETCSAREAAPLICDGSTISGFILNNASCIQNNDGRVLLKYHSFGDFSDWINSQISPGSTVANNISILLTMSAVFVLLLTTKLTNLAGMNGSYTFTSI